MTIHIEHGSIRLTEVTTRIPFRYGIATMTHAPHAFVRLRVRIDGALHQGTSADSLPPKWFTKDPARSLDDEVAEMLRVIEHALDSAQGLVASTVFGAWQDLYAAQAMWGLEQKLPPLLSNFGTSLVERALVDAFCRAAGQPFAKLLRINAFGITAEEFAPDLLPDRPLDHIIVRQTVGLADPLADADIPAAERLDDGLPQSLEGLIRAYGLRHFKIKVQGDLAGDAARLRRIAGILAALAPADFAFSLDGNEQFRTLEAFRDYWKSLTAQPDLQPFLTHLLFVEQPFHRDVALHINTVAAWPDRPAIIIDESDGELESLPRALELGYAGTSHKNCKGVFKGVLNHCRLARRRRERPQEPAVSSGEDLVNIGPVALLQDLAVDAALGIASVERNGHHYFRGLSMFPPAVQQQVLAAHGDLYHASAAGWPTLTIRGGLIDVRSVTAAPFGTGFEFGP